MRVEVKRPRLGALISSEHGTVLGGLIGEGGLEDFRFAGSEC